MKKLLLSGITLLLVFSCSKVPLTDRKQMNLLPESQLIAMALTEYNQFLQQNPPENLSSPEALMVKQTGTKIANAATNFLNKNNAGDRVKNYKWEFNLVESKELNAWCMPGGKVVVYSGLLPVTKDEAGLAFVMGHEIAHAVARHGNERMSQMLLSQAGGVALDVALRNQPAQTRGMLLTAYGVGTTVGAILPFSRLHETEADKMGMIFMAMAGYDPSKAVETWQRMISMSKGPKPPEFLSTHPGDQTRINNIKKYVPQARKYLKR